jgi:hypothetical protein
MLSVQGCSSGAPAQATASTASSAHDVTSADAQAVYQSYLTTSDTAAVSGDSETGLSVVSDAAWEAANAQYTALSSKGTPVTRYQYGTPQFYVPALASYPRWFLTVVPRHAAGTSASAAVTTLMVFYQNKSGAAWTLDGAAALGPGQSLPVIARDEDGYATPLTTYDQSLLVPPDVVGATQAAVVDDGPSSAAAAIVADGAQTTGLYAQQDATSTGATASNLDYTWLMEGASFPVFALRTTDDGALVLYGMYMDTTMEHPDLAMGAPIPIPAGVTPLLAAPTEVGYHAVYANWTFEFAALDPPATSTQKLAVIAASGGISYGHAY